MSKRTKIILGVLGAVVLAFVSMAFIRRKDKDIARVTTAKVEKIDLVAKVTANGKIQARRKVDLSALVMGQIVNLAAKEGDRVQKGQLLLQIDRAQLAARRSTRRRSPRTTRRRRTFRRRNSGCRSRARTSRPAATRSRRQRSARPSPASSPTFR